MLSAAWNPPTVSDTKQAFYENFKKPIPAIYNTVLQELLVQQHLLRWNHTYQYDEVTATATACCLALQACDTSVHSLHSDRTQALHIVGMHAVLHCIAKLSPAEQHVLQNTGARHACIVLGVCPGICQCL